MRILSQNIQWGGQGRCGELARALRHHDPDIILLGEYQTYASQALVDLLARDWPFLEVTSPPSKRGGVAVLSKVSVQRHLLPVGLNAFESRFIAVDVVGTPLHLIGIYGPLEKEPYEEFWSNALAAVAARSATQTLVLGDFNTGESLLDAPRTNFYCSQYFGGFCSAGYVDVWRAHHGREKREYSWFSTANGFRLDHAFASPSLAPHVVSCRYDHAIREQKISDHSGLIVECDLAAA